MNLNFIGLVVTEIFVILMAASYERTWPKGQTLPLTFDAYLKSLSHQVNQ